MTTRIERTVYEVPTAPATPCDPWDDRLVIIERGPVELVSPHGARLTLQTGDMFSTDCTGPVTIRSTAAAAAVITTVHRLTDTSAEAAPPASPNHHASDDTASKQVAPAHPEPANGGDQCPV